MPLHRHGSSIQCQVQSYDGEVLGAQQLAFKKIANVSGSWNQLRVLSHSSILV